MAHVIQQTVTLNASPRELFELYLDSKKHSASTGGPAKISRKPGGSFKAFGGLLWGKTLHVIPNRMIVQSWRSANFKSGDPDSILILQFSRAKNGATIDMTHVNVPVQDRKGVAKGWPLYYWKPWKAHLAKKK